jgi:hypothetical protein
MACLSRTCEIYSFERDAVITGAEKLTLEALPSVSIVQGILQMDKRPRERDLERFAGQGMFLACVGTVLVAYFMNPEAPWWKPPAKRARRSAGTAA